VQISLAMRALSAPRPASEGWCRFLSLGCGFGVMRRAGWCLPVAGAELTAAGAVARRGAYSGLGGRPGGATFLNHVANPGGWSSLVAYRATFLNHVGDLRGWLRLFLQGRHNLNHVADFGGWLRFRTPHVTKLNHVA
jgi:hypothetical protein